MSRKIYIADPMTGIPNFNAFFNEAEEYLRSQGYKVMNPNCLPTDFDWKDYMPICLEMINCCDAVYMLRGWEDSKGANLELDHALKAGKAVLYQEDEF